MFWKYIDASRRKPAPLGMTLLSMVASDHRLEQSEIALAPEVSGVSSKSQLQKSTPSAQQMLNSEDLRG